MQKIQIVVGQEKRDVTVKVLRELVERKFVLPTATLWIDERPVVVRDVMDQLEKNVDFLVVPEFLPPERCWDPTAIEPSQEPEEFLSSATSAPSYEYVGRRSDRKRKEANLQVVLTIVLSFLVIVLAVILGVVLTIPKERKSVQQSDQIAEEVKPVDEQNVLAKKEKRSSTANSVDEAVSEPVNENAGSEKNVEKAETPNVAIAKRTPNVEKSELRDLSGLDWRSIVAKSEEKTYSWENANVAFVVPDDGDLRAALDKAKAGDVIRIKSSEQPLTWSNWQSEPLRFTDDDDVSIVGESDDPNDVVLLIAPNAGLVIERAEVAFKNVTFQSVAENERLPREPLIKVDEGAVTFKNCVFLGENDENSVGLAVGNAEAVLWKCCLDGFGGVAASVSEFGKLDMENCRLSCNETAAVSMNDGKANLCGCLFFKNKCGFVADGGDISLEGAFYEKNDAPWKITPGSEGRVENTRFTPRNIK